ncbi:MAG: right-handed parallel beta-helix repeat-containing protein [Proteobacteria bacterium]|nr:right-handed parallel beta-helix repeat-containing protein [Pseudomonadota bacterium]
MNPHALRRKSNLPTNGLVLAAVIAAPAVFASSTTWWVSNQGLDGASCGTRDKPCRSIGAAVAKANPSDVIEVGAGLYGDLNGDGAFTGPGEERPGTDGNGRTCLICVNKAIKILSLHGADDTIIDAGNNRRADPESADGMVNNVISITSTGTTLGADGAGFTIAGSGGDGVHVTSSVSAGTIIGNIARGNRRSGFDVEVIDQSYTPFPIPLTVTLRGNTAIQNDVGFSASHDEMRGVGETVLVTENTASGNAGGGYEFRGPSFHALLINSVSSNNGAGVRLSGVFDAEIRNNTVTGNIGHGIAIQGLSQSVRIRDNTIVGNTGAGVFMLGFNDNIVIRTNNIYGNSGVSNNPGPVLDSPNCGVINVGMDQPADATNNYWGSARGPGPDPADNGGKGCDFFSTVTTKVTPFATTLFPIRP